MRGLAAEAAKNLDDGIDLPDVCKKLVAEALALARSGHQSGDIDEFELGMDRLRRLGQLCQVVEPRIGHRDSSDIRFDGAERVVGGLRSLRFGQCIEQCRLADVRQSDNPAFEAHAFP